MFDSVSGVFKSISGVFDTLSESIKADILIKKTQAIRNIAISIAILAGSLFLLSQADPENLLTAAKAILVLAGTLAVLTAAMSLIDNKLGVRYIFKSSSNLFCNFYESDAHTDCKDFTNVICDILFD